MKKIKILLGIIVCLTLALGLTASGNAEGAEQNQTTQAASDASEEKERAAVTGTPEASEEDMKADVAAGEENGNTESESGSGIAVIYFSATGTTKGVAEKIAAAENADVYEILAAKNYTSDDLNYNDSNSRTTKEQNDKNVRPEIASEKIDISGYSKIYIGYPIWWGEEPRIMDIFVESYDFGNIVMIPFCTSGGSGIGRSGSNLAENAGSGDWKDGDRLQSSISDSELQAWIEKYK